MLPSMEKDCNKLNKVMKELASLSVEPSDRREKCLRCRRPVNVCWCSYLPKEPVQIMCTIVILQHPAEEKRCLRTAPMLEFSLPNSKFILFKGRRFSLSDDRLKCILQSQKTLLLFPGPSAVNIETLPVVNCENESYNIILIDGTWPQAKAIYANCAELKKVKQVQINSSITSEYVIRTQPTERSLSTVETAAAALSILEGKPYIRDILLQPLKALCSFQLSHGAVTHQSKEYLIKNGLHKSQNIS